jgi:hypothetical protein
MTLCGVEKVKSTYLYTRLLALGVLILTVLDDLNGVVVSNADC